MAGDADAIAIASAEGGVELTVKVVPGASRTRVAGAWGSALKLAVAAPPTGGQANAAVVALLAAVFDTGKGKIAILRGHGQPVKRVAIAGLAVSEARARLARVL